MSLKLVMEQKKEVARELGKMLRYWKILADGGGTPLAPQVVSALKNLRKSVKDLKVSGEELLTIADTVGEFACSVGAAHCILRLLMQALNPNHMKDEIREMIADTRQIVDNLYLCLKLKEPPTMEMAGIVQNAMEAFHKQLQEEGVIEKEVIH